MTALRDTALITGASSGIGEALALVCAQHQYDLVLVARNESKLDALATRLNREYGVDVTARPCDLSAPGNVKQLCETLLADGRQINMLVNNAGVIEHGSFAAITADDHQRIIQVNVCALTDMLAHLLPPMIERGSGRVLNVASLGAFQPLPSVATYAATKAFVLSLSEALVEEVRGTGVTVTVVCPGFTATNMMANAQQKSQTLLKIPSRAIGDANTVAQKAFRACLDGKAILVPGAKNIAASILSRATPKWLVRRIGGIVGRATLSRE
jgi:short-subunit dehydrogenase